MRGTAEESTGIKHSFLLYFTNLSSFYSILFSSDLFYFILLFSLSYSLSFIFFLPSYLSFFLLLSLSSRSLALFRVDELDEGLKNVENVPSDSTGVKVFLEEGKFFQGGNAQMLHKLLQISAGDRLLYVGDHMYAGVCSPPPPPCPVRCSLILSYLM